MDTNHPITYRDRNCEENHRGLDAVTAYKNHKFVDRQNLPSYAPQNTQEYIYHLYYMKRHLYFRNVPAYFIILVILAFITLLYLPVTALSSANDNRSLNDAAMRLVRFCMDPRTGLDEQAVATLVDYVLTSKTNTEHALPESLDCTGAYYEFDTRISFPRFMEYSYNSLIPSVVTRPSSLRYSLWGGVRNEPPKLPAQWKPVASGGAPIVLHGLQHDSNTPDLTTGVYYEYDLKRSLILLNHRGQQVLVSVSKQTRESNVGEKGFIIGSDSDWNYYYSGKPGSAKAGLGWVKSYIYDYFSVGVYVASSSDPVMVRTGVFQWIRAGWSGINFVRTGHVIAGLKRFAQNTRIILESPRLPAPNQMIAAYQWLANLPSADLKKRYEELLQAQRTLAIKSGKVDRAEAGDPLPLVGTSKDQMIEELMLEYVKLALGKTSPVGKQFTLLFPVPLS
ncbi:MAG: hypothetical protein JW902_01840 [Syntrophaceae bacterium]|nr:hypothetical protein [Syntrophaceae bacterium]